MNYEWRNVTPLEQPIQTTGEDVILSGHGAYTFNGETTVPDGIEFHTLAVPAASIADATGQMLESMQKITMLGITTGTPGTLATMVPTVYSAGAKVPNYVLQAPNDLRLTPNGPHLLGVTEDTLLSALWQRVIPFVKAGKTVRCFWAACSAVDGAKNQMVLAK